MPSDIIIHWFRQDLRISDNPSLFEAVNNGSIIPIYILDDENSHEYSMGSGSRWWLHQSLNALNKSLKGNLLVYRGDPKIILVDLVKKHNVKAVYWNRCYEPWRITRDSKLKILLGEHGINCKSFNGSLLWEPWNVLKSDGTPYKVFTPYYKNVCSALSPPRPPFPKPLKVKFHACASKHNSIDELNLLPSHTWHHKLDKCWNVGENKAQNRLHDFIDNELINYKAGRDFPALKNVSRLSPYLHFGEISPFQIWYAIKSIEESDDQAHFLRELGWREFSYNLLYHFQDLPKQNLQSKFNQFPWLKNKKYLDAWQIGKTGYPLIDAGMRELWQTGYMHNRIRMVTGSFLVKNLLLHWHHGERWFWDCLLDADLANNSASWQWIAGCGADAAPYFRVFNPCTQGEKFDPEGEYTRRFVPELAKLPDKFLFSPWNAPEDILKKADITLGKTYPNPIVDLKTSRLRALDAYKSIQKNTFH